MKRVLGNICQIMCFLVNAYLPKPLDVATSNFAGEYVTLRGGYWATFCLTLTLDNVLFLVNASSKFLDVATSNFAGV